MAPIPRNTNGGYHPTLIEYVQYGIVLIKTYFQTGIRAERDVSENDTESDGDKQQWFEIFLYRQIYEDCSDNNHGYIACSGVGKASIGKKLVEVLNQEICKSHNDIKL